MQLVTNCESRVLITTVLSRTEDSIKSFMSRKILLPVLFKTNPTNAVYCFHFVLPLLKFYNPRLQMKNAYFPATTKFLTESFTSVKLLYRNWFS